MFEDNNNPEDLKKMRFMQNIFRIALCLAILCIAIGAMRLLTKTVHSMEVTKNKKHENKQVAAPKEPVSDEEEATETAETTKTKKTKKTKADQKETQPETKKNYVVCLDPGHGGSDGGSTSGDRKEADDTLRITKEVKKELEARGVNVIMTRETDDYVSLEERTRIANDAGVDYFVSIHRNSGPGIGMETWVNSQANEVSQALGQNIHDDIQAVGIQKDRGLKLGSQSGAGNYYVIRCTNMPSCIVELGFVSNEDDNKDFDDKYLEYAAAIADGIEETARDCKQEQTSHRYEEHRKVLDKSLAEQAKNADTAESGTAVSATSADAGVSKEAIQRVDKSLDSKANN